MVQDQSGSALKLKGLKLMLSLHLVSHLVFQLNLQTLFLSVVAMDRRRSLA
jgi:hypothetical protein